MRVLEPLPLPSALTWRESKSGLLAEFGGKRAVILRGPAGSAGPCMVSVISAATIVATDVAETEAQARVRAAAMLRHQMVIESTIPW